MNLKEYMQTHSLDSKDEALMRLARVCYEKGAEYKEDESEFLAMIADFSKDDKTLFFQHYTAEINKNPELLRKGFKETLWLDYIGLTKEEFRQLNSNPFGSQIRKFAMIFLISCAFPLLFILMYTIIELDVLKTISLICLGIFSLVSICVLFPLSRSIVQFFVFRKLKKHKLMS